MAMIQCWEFFFLFDLFLDCCRIIFSPGVLCQWCSFFPLLSSVFLGADVYVCSEHVSQKVTASLLIELRWALNSCSCSDIHLKWRAHGVAHAKRALSNCLWMRHQRGLESLMCQASDRCADSFRKGCTWSAIAVNGSVWAVCGSSPIISLNP